MSTSWKAKLALVDHLGKQLWCWKQTCNRPSVARKYTPVEHLIYPRYCVKIQKYLPVKFGTHPVQSLYLYSYVYKSKGENSDVAICYISSNFLHT